MFMMGGSRWGSGFWGLVLIRLVGRVGGLFGLGDELEEGGGGGVAVLCC